MGLIASDIDKRYGRRRVLSRLSFRCDPGEILAVTGENGSGKSTLLAILAGVIEADGGGATLGGEALIGRRAPARARIGYVPEAANPPARLTARALFALVASLKSAERPAASMIERLAAGALLDQTVASMSLGQRRRVCLVAALIGEPALVILDEPTNGLDDAGVAALVETLAEVTARDGSVVLATHDSELIDRIDARELKLRVES